MTQADAIRDPEQRRLYLDNVPENLRLLALAEDLPYKPAIRCETSEPR